jgi:hypothetical protein
MVIRARKEESAMRVRVQEVDGELRYVVSTLNLSKIFISLKTYIHSTIVE